MKKYKPSGRILCKCTMYQKTFGVIPLKAVYIRETTSEQNCACNTSKNVQFLCYEGFCIFITNFKGNKNVILASISKVKM